MQSPKLIVFDCDGVLVDSEVLSAEALVAALADERVSIDVDYVLQTYLGRSPTAIGKDVLARTGVALNRSFFESWTERLLSTYRAMLAPVPGVVDLLRSLETPVCVASGSAPERLRATLEIAGLARFFGDRAFSAVAVPRGKPAPDLFLHAAAACGAEPAACLVIEDSLPGVRAARAAGMHCWQFRGASHFRRSALHFDWRAAGAARAFDRMETMGAAIRTIADGTER